jgi:hypothetical protein
MLPLPIGQGMEAVGSSRAPAAIYETNDAIAQNITVATYAFLWSVLQDVLFV